MSDHLITTMQQLEALYGERNPNSIIKELDRISAGYRKLIEAAPFVAVATSGSGRPRLLAERRRRRFRAHSRRQDARHS